MKTKITVIVLVLFLNGITAAADSVIPPKRIVSLAPNTTEILFALGLGDRVAGVTSFCDHPQEAKKKPKIGGMSNPSLEAVVSMKPDIVVMTTDGNPREFEERLRSLHIRTYVDRARRLSELPDAIRELGKALGIKDRAERLADSMQADLNRHGKSTTAIKGRKVLFIVWPAGFRWHPYHPHYEQMIVGIYATLGVFLIIASRDPMAHKSLIWFTVWSSFVHGAIMAVQALYDGREHGHLVGDAPALLLIAAVLWFLSPKGERFIEVTA